MKNYARLAILFASLFTFTQAAEFSSNWKVSDRPWIGPNYWAGPLQDWRLADGRLECFVSGGNRLVFLTTHEVGETGDGFELSVQLGRIGAAKAPAKEKGGAGFRIGIQGTLPDYRNAAIFGKGTHAGLQTEGKLFMGNRISADRVDPTGSVRLTLSVKGGQARLTATDQQGASARVEAPLQQVTGHVALVCHRNSPANPKAKRSSGGGSNRGGDVRFWFDHWTLSGPQVTAYPERAWGPILWTQYTLSKGVMKMNAQLAPLGAKGPREALLRYGGQVARAAIDPLSCTATFRVEKWQDGKDHDFAVSLPGTDATWTGTVRKDPVDQETLVLAGFTGNTDYIFPDAHLVGNVARQNPDVLFFSGDQLYEGVAGYGVQRTWGAPLETVTLDYLRKWYLFGWAWKEELRDRPSLCFPDDHDVYQGNIWGAGGIASKMRGGFADGGYGMAAAWVNAVQRTQCAHMPDPYDPTPIAQDISVYYGDFNYGRVSFAMLEDRKFKSGPATALPDKGGRPDHVRPNDVDAKTWDPYSIDVPQAKLLGDRQLKFLDHWAADWTKADFKVVLSQTIFCNLANYHGGGRSYLIADLDSNGWPQTGRNKALKAMRKGFAFHCAGDQHLASIVHHGVDTWNDAGYSFCVPSIPAGYPRSWLPDKEGRPVQNRPAAGLPNTGEYREGLGNHVTVHAIANPALKNRKGGPEMLGHDKASGHGIVRFNKRTREITMECWRLLVDVRNPQPSDQFPGWPKTIKLEDNYGRDATGWLPTLEIQGMEGPVVQVVDEASGDIVYTLRIAGTTFQPKVFSTGPFTVIVGEPAEGRVKKLRGIKPRRKNNGRLEIQLP